MLEYLEPFIYMKTVEIFVCKQITYDSCKNKITHKLLTKTSSV